MKIESFAMFPPFHTDCGKNTKIGKRVFINAGCQFQDQGGITIGDDVLVGPQTIIATPHFRKYKEGTPHMIKSLELVPMRPLDAEHMNRIFRKEGI